MARHHDLISRKDWVPVVASSKKSGDDGIKSWTLRLGKSTPMVKAVSTVHKDAESLFKFLVTNIADTCSEWNDLMYFSEVLQKFEAHDADMIRVASEGGIAADREDVCVRFMVKQGQSTFLELCEGVSREEIPIDKSRTRYILRSQMHFCSKQIEKLSDGTALYTAIWQYDIRGLLSLFLPDRVLTKILAINMRNEHEQIATIFSGSSST